MHKSYKYILIFLTTVLIFSTVFSVQKVSANYTFPSLETINLVRTADGEYDIEKYLPNTTEKYLEFQSKVNELYGNDVELQYILVTGFNSGYKYPMILVSDGDMNLYYKTSSWRIETTGTRVMGMLQNSINTDVVTSGITVGIYNDYKITGFFPRPLGVEVKEIPSMLMMGAMTILPVGLVVLSILLGILLIPRLINYFRH